MPTSYRVLDMRPAAGTGELQDRTEVIIDSAKSPEAAARDALGLELVRSGTRLKDAASEVSAHTGHSSRELYQAALAVKG